MIEFLGICLFLVAILLLLLVARIELYSRDEIYKWKGNFYRIVGFKDPNLIRWRCMKKFLFWYIDDYQKDDFFLDWVDGEFLKID